MHVRRVCRETCRDLEKNMTLLLALFGSRAEVERGVCIYIFIIIIIIILLYTVIPHPTSI